MQTEDPETIGSGRILIEAGVDYNRDVNYPVSGLRGNLFTVPTLGVSLGVSSIAEIQMHIGGYQQLTITDQVPTAPFANFLLLDGDTTDDLEDMHVGAKVRLVSETAGRPSLATRFSTRLPNAGNESGLGKDMQDFETSILLAKTIQSVRVVGNVGLLMLGNPTRPAAQDDLLFYNLSVARAVSAEGRSGGRVCRPRQLREHHHARRGRPRPAALRRSLYPRRRAARRRHPAWADAARSRDWLHRRLHVGVPDAVHDS